MPVGMEPDGLCNHLNQGRHEWQTFLPRESPWTTGFGTLSFVQGFISAVNAQPSEHDDLNSCRQLEAQRRWQMTFSTDYAFYRRLRKT